MDEIVYRLYGLTYDDIAMVDEAGGVRVAGPGPGRGWCRWATLCRRRNESFYIGRTSAGLEGFIVG